MTNKELLEEIAYQLYRIEFRLRTGESCTYQPCTKKEFLGQWDRKAKKKK